MKSTNIPEVKLGIIAVSRDCFPIALSTQRRENIVKAYKGELFNCQTTVENDDWLNIYANYDMEHRRVCDTLEVFLVHGDGSEQDYKYCLSEEEQALLLPKMEDYCQQQTGMSLADYSAQCMAEDMAPPIGPAM